MAKKLVSRVLLGRAAIASKKRRFGGGWKVISRTKTRRGCCGKHEDQVALRKLGFRDRLVSAGGNFDVWYHQSYPRACVSPPISILNIGVYLNSSDMLVAGRGGEVLHTGTDPNAPLHMTGVFLDWAYVSMVCDLLRGNMDSWSM